LYCQDESRFGLFTRNGKGLTAKGVKPVCNFQQVFKSLYLFGAFSPNVSEFITNEVNILTKSEIKSICGFEYLFSCDYWTKTY